MKIYLFMQDHQMYYNSIVKFSCEIEIPEGILAECSSGDGRMSRSFKEFAQALEKKGFPITPMKIDYTELFDGFIVCPVIYGGSGNIKNKD